MASAADPFSDPQTLSDHPPPTPEKASHGGNILDAVRDVVTVKGDRAKLPRSHTNQPTPNSTAPTSRRVQSDESIPRSSDRKSKSKKAGGAHTDVIDRLDFTGIGTAALHHDGPFDACAPSRNKNKAKAPMSAWSPRDEQEFNVPSVPPPNDSRISPRAQATMAAMASMAPGLDGPYGAARSLGDSGPYPRMPAGNGLSDWGTAPPKKRHDALAEAWGVHEPEPFEEFMAGGGEHSRPGSQPGSVRSGIEGNSKKGTTLRDGREAREVYKDYLDDKPSSRRREPRTKLPPPAPIALPGSSGTFEDDSLASNYMASSYGDESNGPKRSKSLLNRIRKGRATPNVPVGTPEERANEFIPSPGRAEFADTSDGPTSPGLPTLGPSGSPPRNSSEKKEEYFDRPGSASGVGAMPQSPGQTGLGRKPSLMQKIRGAARGNKQ
ncbi:Pal1 cell morphology protein-domain-containing protein [Auriculariales sp. MPI-PUGE-AT-0066]|nr:Pal1 cell morphology protein-domain-containing protein [Auriculariales sp. MPI-PUGE-AT-0066]